MEFLDSDSDTTIQIQDTKKKTPVEKNLGISDKQKAHLAKMRELKALKASQRKEYRAKLKDEQMEAPKLKENRKDELIEIKNDLKEIKSFVDETRIRKQQKAQAKEEQKQSEMMVNKPKTNTKFEFSDSDEEEPQQYPSYRNRLVSGIFRR